MVSQHGDEVGRPDPAASGHRIEGKPQEAGPSLAFRSTIKQPDRGRAGNQADCDGKTDDPGVVFGCKVEKGEEHR